MDFNTNKAIYLQIAELVCEQIMLGIWRIEDKIPSVRELAVQLEVNPNTVMRTYDLLQQKGIIFNKRGIGFFLDMDSIKKAQEYKKAIFVEDELPQMFRNMHLLSMDMDELKDKYISFVKQNYKTN